MRRRDLMMDLAVIGVDGFLLTVFREKVVLIDVQLPHAVAPG